ncbi:MAG: TIGR02301 family protein [Bauldia sp.]
MKSLSRLVLALVVALSGGSARSAEGDPAYEPQLLRLAEVLGGLAFLRPLCGSPDAQRIRTEMTTLLDAEQPTPARRARLIDRFNLGYQGFAAVYRVCTPAAALEAERYRREGAELARDLTTRFVR